ncbi:hypothetical protein Tco_1029364 [Tanacetum coccineum]|uniref:Uncharacterized protein n=1 Tax=Tanacetum coccineum TaxID=301880 RepID=A0ABQ5G375_9ASTR
MVRSIFGKKRHENGAIEFYDEEVSETIVNKQRVKPYQKNLLDANKDDDVTLDDEGELFVHEVIMESSAGNFSSKNKNFVFTERGDGVMIYRRRRHHDTCDGVTKTLTASNAQLYLMRRSLEVLRKFHWMILGGRFNQLSHVSSPLLSKPGEYYFAFGRHLDELHVTWAYLENKRTRLQTNTKTLEDLCSQSLETASQAIHDVVTTHQVLENQLLSASLLICLGKRDCVERIPSGNSLHTTLPPNMVDPLLIVPAIYMHEFWATVSFHKQCIKFKLNKKNHSFDMETFKDMLQISPNLPSQKFVDPPFEEEILAFIRKLGYYGDIKSLSDVKVDTLHQPWRTFGTIINKCLSGKVTGLDQLRISRAQIIWGMYYQKNVDYVYLLWEDLVYQIKNKVSKVDKKRLSKDLTKVIINYFMSKDQSIPRRNKKTDQAPKDSPGKRLKATTKVAKSGKKKLPAQGLDTLSEIALSEADQMKLITKRSKTQFHSSHASGSGANEGTGVSLGVPDVPTYGSEDDQISWKFSNEDDDDEVRMCKDDDDNADNEDDDDQDDDQDDDNEQIESDNDGDDFVRPKFSTHDEEERQDEEDKEEECSDLRVHTPSHYESTNNEVYDEVTQGGNVVDEKLDEEKSNEEE